MFRALLLAVVALAACGQPALTTDARKAALLSQLQAEVLASVESEKSAVLATTDDDSERFAAQSRAASAAVDRARAELRALAGPEERQKLDAFDTAWAKVMDVDAKLLPLAVANTNLKAAALSSAARADLDAVLTQLTVAARDTNDPSRLRTLMAASVAAGRIQALHAPHIASPSDAEMTAIEARIAALVGEVDAALTARDPKTAKPLSAAAEPWARYQQQTKKIIALSRANTNVLSLSMSLHEKADATRACVAALDELIASVHAVPRATR